MTTTRLGDFFAFYLALLALCVTLDTLTHMLLQINNSMRLLEQSEKIFHEATPSPHKVHNLNLGKETIRLEKVSFQYQECSTSLFQDLSLKIAPREKVAIVGPPSCGKTTLIRLLLGLEHPDSGTVFFGDHSLENLDLKTIRQSIGTVFDTEGIFAGTIYENITIGKVLPMEQIEKASELAGFQKDLETYPMGISTLLPERGTSISSGERQRLLLARALASNPSLLLLDQAFCLLDFQSREHILINLQKLPITQIFTTQDPEPFKNIVDRVIYLDNVVTS
ncbi:ATP-binding cassette domain-containing protein [Simkania sp.]|uniref:ATP-binding cassette domain-containing protein n=1 Tax=Simkania sp. TaxID=34094 RepID=UPI003B52A3B9